MKNRDVSVSSAQGMHLSKTLNIVETVSLAASDISPTSGVFLNMPVAIAMVGTGSFLVSLMAGIIAICVALTMAEIGSAFPKSGGIYSVIHRVMGKKVGFLALVAYLVEGVFIPAVTSMGSATYLAAVFPALKVNLLAPALMLIAMLISIANISSTGKFTTFLLALELLVVLTITIACLLNLKQPVSVLFSTQVIHGNSFSNVSWPTIFSTIAVMLFSFNGFDSALNFSEEMSGNQKSIGRSVFGAASIGIIAQLIPLAVILLAAPSLKGFLKSSNPILYVSNDVLGPTMHDFLSLGISLAMFACTISVLLQFSRVLYTSGRDNMWPKTINHFLQSIHPKFKTPWKATLFLGVVDIFLNFVSNLGDLISFTSVLVVLLYALIGICDIIARGKKVSFPYKNTFGIMAPIITIVASVYVLSRQTFINLLISLVILAVSFIYVSLFKKADTIDLNL
ncbi:APC family permease [Oenococcus oeni]|uniref:Amino acid transporter n=3 Tax=Oenococcus oeni TaxID=1247 RepID=Q04DX6_OENOB|nr:APC family permease [Oenococcus oeni]ABJ57346.1 Amino acid transporter [Oenococcus oeni PSU-1]KGH54653.1 amino acid transporter [Oenococcus oeni IOEB_S277]KGH58595.1 amino acid transporter [Oenococcus oeni IOEB_9805]KGH75251.1 amino acid transporter [Oenococcus oeni IOEB_9803]KGH76946.1 amino acid transporter [Oenococcus oeni IOEB_8417]